MGTIGVRGRRWGRRTLAPLRSRAHALQDHKEHRHEGDGQQGRGHHSAEHHRTDRLLARRARAECEHQRHHAQDEGERRHHDGAKSAAGCLDGGFFYGHALVVQVSGEFHDENRVLARQGDHQDETDLSVQVAVEAAAEKRQDDAHQGQGNDQDDGAGRGPALVQRGEHQVDQDDGEGIDEVGLIAHLFLLVARRGPVIGHALGQRLSGQLLHEGEGLSGAESRSGAALNGRRRVEVVAGDQLRALDLLDLQQGVQGDHLPVQVADEEISHVLGLETEAAIGLDIDLEDLIELVEEVDERRAQIALECLEHARRLHLERLRLGPVDVQEELWAVGAEGGGQALQIGIRIPFLDQLVRVALEFRQTEARAIFHHHLEAARLAEATDRRRDDDKARASWIPASSRLRLETIRSWLRALPRSFQLLYTTNVVEMLGTLAKSRTEKPPIWTQASIPSVFCRMALTFAATSMDRGWEAPSGRTDTRMAQPWSSVGRKPVGRRANSQTVTLMMMANTMSMRKGRLTIR